MQKLLQLFDYDAYRAGIFRRIIMVAAGIALAGPLIDLLLWLIYRDAPPVRASSLVNAILIALFLALLRLHRRWSTLSEVLLLTIIIGGTVYISMLLGGATRHVLKNAVARPVLMAH